MSEDKMIETIKEEARKAWNYLEMLENFPARSEELIAIYKTKWTTLDELCDLLKIKVVYY